MDGIWYSGWPCPCFVSVEAAGPHDQISLFWRSEMSVQNRTGRPPLAARDRSRRVLKGVAGLLMALCLGAPAAAQVTHNEVEPNDVKGAANGPFVMAAGDMIVGLS